MFWQVFCVSLLPADFLQHSRQNNQLSVSFLQNTEKFTLSVSVSAASHLFRLNLRVLCVIVVRVGLDTRTTCSGFRRLFGSMWSQIETVSDGLQESWRRYRRMDRVGVFSGSWRGSGSVQREKTSRWTSHGFKLSAAESSRSEILWNSIFFLQLSSVTLTTGPSHRQNSPVNSELQV